MSDPQPSTDPKRQAPAVREIGSEEIFRGTKTVVISHDGVKYRLLMTRNNKLILHK